MRAINSCCPLICLCFVGCDVHRGDTTGAMRQLVSKHMGIAYDQAKPNATLKALNCDELDVVELIMEIEDSFAVTISDEEFDALGEWETIT